MNILILGHAQHGKDTLAKIIIDNFGLNAESSSEAALRIFLFAELKLQYNLEYKTLLEAYEDRVNHRDKWYKLICEYNKNNQARLAKEIMQDNDIYIGMRSLDELIECKKQKVFDLILGIYDPTKVLEDISSNTIDPLVHSDLLIVNNGTIEDLKNKTHFINFKH